MVHEEELEGLDVGEREDLSRKIDRALVLFGRRVRDIRARRGFSQEELAGVCGLTQSFLSRVEAGQESPSFSSVFLIADALRVSMIDLFNIYGGRRAYVIDRLRDAPDQVLRRVCAFLMESGAGQVSGLAATESLES